MEYKIISARFGVCFLILKSGLSMKLLSFRITLFINSGKLSIENLTILKIFNSILISLSDTYLTLMISSKISVLIILGNISIIFDSLNFRVDLVEIILIAFLYKCVNCDKCYLFSASLSTSPKYNGSHYLNFSSSLSKSIFNFSLVNAFNDTNSLLILILSIVPFLKFLSTLTKIPIGFSL